MIPDTDPRRCPTCKGIHERQPCPLSATAKKFRPITEEEDAITCAFLARCTRGQQFRKRSNSAATQTDEHRQTQQSNPSRKEQAIAAALMAAEND